MRNTEYLISGLRVYPSQGDIRSYNCLACGIYAYFKRQRCKLQTPRYHKGDGTLEK